MRKFLLLSAIAVLPLAACNPATESNVEANVTTNSETAVAPGLDAILDSQKEAVKARYTYRHPQQTIEYFGIKPGMTVAEVLPGGGWYSSILLPYLGDGGQLIGIDYDVDMWAKFGGFATPQFLEQRKSWAETWTADAEKWRSGSNAAIKAFALGDNPKDLKDTADVVLLIRAIHHLHRFDQAHLGDALNDIKLILKPDGIVGIVQHRANEDQADAWAAGDNGYMKQSRVIEIMEEAGFELAAEPSEINANPKDNATSDNKDSVWRLPPSLRVPKDDPELKAKMEAIGETDRMTLKFKLKK